MRIEFNVEDLMRDDEVGKINRKLIGAAMALTRQVINADQQTAEATQPAEKPAVEALKAETANQTQQATAPASEPEKMTQETRKEVVAAVVNLRAEAKKAGKLAEASLKLRDFLNEKCKTTQGQRVTIDDLDEPTGRAYAALARQLTEELAKK